MAFPLENKYRQYRITLRGLLILLCRIIVLTGIVVLLIETEAAGLLPRPLGEDARTRVGAI